MYAIELQAQVAERQEMSKRRFTRALFRGRYRALWLGLRGKPVGLLDLTAFLDQRSTRSVRSAGHQTVPLARIRGSEGRSHDFDAAFHPRHTRTRDRWLQIARARLDGMELAPVELIQVGDIYFVRDGHHRISVAITFGQREIDAVVTTWETDAPVVGAVAPTGQGRRQLLQAGRWWSRSGKSDAGAGSRVRLAEAGSHACAGRGAAPDAVPALAGAHCRLPAAPSGGTSRRRSGPCWQAWASA